MFRGIIMVLQVRKLVMMLCVIGVCSAMTGCDYRTAQYCVFDFLFNVGVFDGGDPDCIITD